MTNTEISTSKKVMLGSMEVTAMYIGSILIWQNEVSPNITGQSTISS